MKRVVCAVLVLITGCDQVDTHLPGFSLPPVEAWVPEDGWVTEQVRRYGDLDGPLSFGYISHVAVRSDGSLAVVDLLSPCSIVLIQVPMAPRQRDDGSWMSGVAGTFVGCGDSGALFGMVEPRETSPDDTTSSAAGARREASVFVEMRAYDGRLLLRSEIESRRHPLYGRVAGMAGDTAFVVSRDEQGLYPVITEVVLKPRAPATVSN